MGLFAPVGIFSILVFLPIYLSLPVLFLLFALSMRFLGAAYPSLPTASPNPFATTSAVSAFSLSALVFVLNSGASLDEGRSDEYLLAFFGALYAGLWVYLAKANPGFVGKHVEIRYSSSALIDLVGDGKCGDEDIPDLCTVCMKGRPLRSVHCASCGKCVALRDHHSHWSGQCVGVKNAWVYYASCVVAVVAHFLFMKFCGGALDALLPDDLYVMRRWRERERERERGFFES
jgi:hypothetical protein